MSKVLIIAEKPSVASDLARVLSKELGKFTLDKAHVYYESDQAVITSARGHLLVQKKPMTPEGKSLPWKFDCLPVLPDKFELEPNKATEDRLKKILQLAKRSDVVEIVNACDAGREGELIFNNMVRYGKWKKPTRRLWMQSMTDEAILSAWHHLRSEEAMEPLTAAAICRSESDWLIGLNSTRALTVLQSRGGFNITTAGRVQTPTLAILTKREREIMEFEPEPYSVVHADFKVQAGVYTGQWIDLNFKKNDGQPNLKPERIWDPKIAEAIRARCNGKSGTVAEEKKRVSTIAPLLYDLTSLQRDASNRFGFSARRTLQLTQECYEKFKVLTYPRTDSRYLPNDYIGKVREIISSLEASNNGFSPFASDILKNDRIKPNRRIFDTSKVSDHFAIIPTGNFVTLPADTQKIFDMVLARFLAVFFPPAIHEETKRSTRITHEDGTIDAFHSAGRILVEPGWQALYGRIPGNTGKDELVPVSPGEKATVSAIDIENAMTKPPAHLSEGALLSAMEGAGKQVDDEELREALRERGLGTPATRDSIIEGLITQDYIVREKKEIIATRKGIELIDLLQHIGLETLTSPSMTGEWEYKLKQMEQGALDRPSFMRDIRTLTSKIVSKIKDFRDETQRIELPEMPLTCPSCGAQGLRNTLDAVSCRSCKFSLRKTISGRDLSDGEITQLITTGKTDILTGFTSRFGKPFEAGLQLDEKYKAKFYFPERPESESPGEQEEPTPAGHVTTKDGKEYEVLQTSKVWKIPTFPLGKTQGLTVSRVILGRTIALDELQQIISEGKSPLLKGFISQRTKRAFDAYLVLNSKSGKITFQFDRTERKTSNKPSSATKSPKSKTSEEGEVSAPKSTPKKQVSRTTKSKGTTTRTRKTNPKD